MPSNNQRGESPTFEPQPLDPERVHKKLQIAAGLFEMAFKTKVYQLAQKFPELTESDRAKKAYALIERGCA